MTGADTGAEIGRYESGWGGTAGRQRFAVAAAFFGNGLLIGSWAPHIPVFAARHGLTPATMSWVILALGVGAVASMPVVARIIGGQGSRRPMIALTFLLAFALPAVVLSPWLWLAVLAVVGTGVATGGMDVAMNANAVVLERRMPMAIMSSCHGFWSLGGLLGAGIGGFGIATLGAPLHALLVGLAIFACAIVVQRQALSDAPAAPSASGHGDGRASRPADGGLSVGYRGAALIGFFALFAMVPEGAAIDWSAFYLRRELAVPEAASGLAFAAFSATMAVMRFAGDGVRDRLGAVRTAQVCSLMAIAGLLAAGFAGTATVAIIGFAVMGIGISNMVPIAFSAAGNLPGLKPGAGLAIVSAMGYSGILIAPTVIGYFGEVFSFADVFLGLSAFLVVTFIISPVMKLADGAD